MQSKSFIATIALFILSTLTVAINGAAIGLRAAKDVFVPTILTPNQNTTWTVGQVEQVTWDTSNAPRQISNGASVVLDGVGILAKGFDLRSGSVNVTVPKDVKPGQYSITLFGDSGNVSPLFAIVASQADSESSKTTDADSSETKPLGL